MTWDFLTIVATFLLVLRAASVCFMTLVLRRQYKLFAEPVEPDATQIRQVLFGFAIVIMLGQIIPIIIGAYTILASGPAWSAHPLLVSEAINNAVKDVLSSILFWLIYRFIAKQNVRLAQARKDAK